MRCCSHRGSRRAAWAPHSIWQMSAAGQCPLDIRAATSAAPSSHQSSESTCPSPIAVCATVRMPSSTIPRPNVRSQNAAHNSSASAGLCCCGRRATWSTPLSPTALHVAAQPVFALTLQERNLKPIVMSNRSCRRRFSKSPFVCQSLHQSFRPRR